MRKILVVDDEPRVTSNLRSLLSAEGYGVLAAATGEAALKLDAAELPDLVILDLMLPDMDGLDVCRALKQRRQIPILMLTARGALVDKVMGLETGADDYLTKPYALQELLARVKALLRRLEAPLPDTRLPTSLLTAGALRLDLFSRRATFGERQLMFRPKEFDLLAFLMSHRGRVFSREELLEKVWGYSPDDGTRTIAVHIRGLRAKLEAAQPQASASIETVRGSGYRFKG